MQALRTAWAQLDWTALKRLADGDGLSAEAARFALDWRKEQRSLKKIEYIFLDALVKRLKEAGLQFDTDPADQRWLWREARLRDPSGNPICLFAAGANRLNPPWRIQESLA